MAMRPYIFGCLFVSDLAEPPAQAGDDVRSLPLHQEPDVIDGGGMLDEFGQALVIQAVCPAHLERQLFDFTQLPGGRPVPAFSALARRVRDADFRAQAFEVPAPVEQFVAGHVPQGGFAGFVMLHLPPLIVIPAELLPCHVRQAEQHFSVDPGFAVI